MLGNLLRSGRTTRRMAWAVLAVAAAVLGQTPAREYIRLGGRVIAIESPAAPTTTTRYTLSVVASGASTPNVTITPNSACTQNTGGSSSGSTPGTATCNADAVVEISASAAQFSSWTGGVTTPSAPTTTVRMDGNKTLVANYVAAGNINITLSTVPPEVGVLTVDNSPVAVPGIRSWLPGSSHDLLAADVVNVAAGVRYLFERWDNGSTTPLRRESPTTAVTYTASFRTEYLVKVEAGLGGQITAPVVPTAWRVPGSVTITAAPLTGYTFIGWTGIGDGSYTGTSLSASINVTNSITQTANFRSQTAPPVLTPPSDSTYGTSAQRTFTASTPSSWTVMHSNGNSFVAGNTADGFYVIPQNGLSLTYTSPNQSFPLKNLKITATATNGAGAVTADLTVIPFDRPPKTDSVTDLSFGSGPNTNGTFRIDYSDPDTSQDINYVEVVFHSSVAPPPFVSYANFSNYCYVHVDRVTRVLSLANTSGLGWADQDVLDTNRTITNGKCSIDLGLSSLTTPSPTVLRLNLRISEFRPTADNPLWIHTYVRDNYGYSYNQSFWQRPGVWTAPSATSPTITNVTSPQWFRGTSAVIRWTTNIGTTTRVDYGITTGYGATTENTALVTDHAALLSGLNPGVTYYYKIVSRSADGLTVEQPGGSILTGPTASQAIGIFNTGVNGASQPLPAGAQDPHYTLVVVPPLSTVLNPPNTSFVVNDGSPVGTHWMDNSAQSKWIAPSALQWATPWSAEGTFKYRTTFDLTGKDPTTAVLRGRFAADNSATVYLNGQPIQAADGFAAWTDFVVNSGFQNGLNTFDIEVRNWFVGGNNPSGLRLEISGNVVPLPPGPLLTDIPFNPAVATVGTNATGQVILSPAPTSPVTVTLSALPAGIVSIPASVQVSSTSAPFAITPIAAGPVTITASLGAGNSVSRVLTVNPAGGGGGGSSTAFYTSLPGLYGNHPHDSGSSGWKGGLITAGSTAVTVTHLGRKKIGTNSQPHRVGIFASSWASPNPLVEVTVNMQTGTVEADGFVYGQLPGTGYVLPATGVYYVATLEEAGKDEWQAPLSAALPVTTGVATAGCGVWGALTAQGTNSGFNCFKSADYLTVFNEPAGPVNFKYATGGAPSLLFHSGVGPTGALLAGGAADPHFTLISAPAGVPVGPATVVSNLPGTAWLANSSTSKWIGPGADQATGSPAGGYVYRTTFNPGTFSTANLQFKYASDNSVTIRLNGNVVGPNTPGFAALLGPVTLTSGFVQNATNTLDFEVTNDLNVVNPTGLRVEIVNATFTP